jgi:alginate O-acetyltransferase complex protein AlgJ
MASTGYLPDRPRPAWFGVALAALFVASIVAALAGSFRTPRQTNPFEKRPAEMLPPVPDTVGALRAYPAAFERFFDDRFGMRATLVHIDHWTRAMMFGISPVPKVLLGKAGWLYFLGEDANEFDRWYRGSEPIADATIVAIRDELLRRQAFLARRGIAYVVTVIPEKYTVYPEFLPEWAARRADRTPFDRLAAELAREPQLKFIDLRAPLSRAKGGERLYYKTDSHWNYLGATVGYHAIMLEVTRLLPGLTIAPVSRPPYVAGVDFYSGDLAQMLGLPRQFREDDIAPLGKILANSESRCAKEETPAAAPNIQTYVYRCANAPRYTALMYRDSMAIPLIPMLAENFARTTFVTSQDFDPALVERLKPDIVIEGTVERTLAYPAYFPMQR